MPTKSNLKIWMVRAGSRGVLFDEFQNNNIVAIGWNKIGALPPHLTYEQLKELLSVEYVDWSPAQTAQNAGQIWRFYNEFKIGDKVITYDSSARVYLKGEIKSEYKYSEEQYEFHHYRDVEWDDWHYDRDDLDIDSRNSLGSLQTIFEVSHEIWEAMRHPGEVTEEELLKIEELQAEYERMELENLKSEVVSKSTEFIKDLIANLSWQDTERLSAGLLRTMGYKTRFTPRGGDLGSDIIASPDVLGLEEPRIKVEVKKRTKDKISAEQIRSFIGGMRDFNKGIYLTTSGFTKEAKYEAERANFPITLIDSDWLVELVVENYELMEPEIQALVPLRRIYWPVQ